MADHLQSGYRFTDFEIRRVLRRDSVGVEYEAFCTRAGRPVSIKEYFPEGLADRLDSGAVVARSEADASRFDAGLARFFAQHRTLGSIDHPVIVNVRECLSVHGTGYAVMDLPEGKTLEARLENGVPLTRAELASVFGPMLDGLQAAHQAGLLHRQINPENIVIRPGAPPVLLRFGAPPPAASGPRQAFSPRAPSFFGLLTPGYAALEQYSHRGQEGPWTDIYALGAVMYRCVTGIAPIDALDRAVHDDLVPAARAARGSYDRPTLLGIDAALALRAAERPRSVAAWRRRLPVVGSTARSAPATGSRFGARPLQRPRQAPQPGARSAATVQRSAASAGPTIAQARAAREPGRSRAVHRGPNRAVPALAATLLIALLTWLDTGVLRSSGDGADTRSATPQQLAAAQPEDIVQPPLAAENRIEFDNVESIAAASETANPPATPEEGSPTPRPAAQARAQERQEAQAVANGAGAADVLRTPALAQPKQRIPEKDALAPAPATDARDNSEADGRTKRLLAGTASEATPDAGTPEISLPAGDGGVRATRTDSASRESVVRHATPSMRQQVTRMQTATEFVDPLSSGGVGPAMVTIPPGAFRMGCVSGRECFNNELPLRDVAVNRPIALSKFEITYNDYDRFTQATHRPRAENPANWERGALPVVSVSWKDAADYTAWLAGETGRNYRLPTESEWEYAARAQTDTAYNWGNAPGDGLANCTGCSTGDTHWGTAPVGSFAANPWGLHDVHGNVWEWVADCGNSPQSAHRSMASQSTAADCRRRVRRGGSWVHSPPRMRSASRDVTTSQLRSLDTGFRVLLQLE